MLPPTTGPLTRVGVVLLLEVGSLKVLRGLSSLQLETESGSLFELLLASLPLTGGLSGESGPSPLRRAPSVGG